MKLKRLFYLHIKNDQSYRQFILLNLYQRQTAVERVRKETIESNLVGFQTFDAPVLTKLAEKLLAGKRLTAKEEEQLVKSLPKYWGQFTVTKLVELPFASRPRNNVTGLQGREVKQREQY